MSKSREIKTAVLVLSSIFLFIWGYTFLASKNLFKSTTIYYVIYDNVEGLLPKAPVTLNGLTIGNIDDIRFLDNRGRLLVTMSVATDFPISKNSKAEIYEPGLIGGKQLAIIPDYKDTRLAISGDTLMSAVQASMKDLIAQKLVPLEQKVESAIVSADSLLRNINALLTSKNRKDISKSLAELSQTLENVNSMSKNADLLLSRNKEKLDNVIGNFDKTMSNFSKISSNLEQANLGKTVKELEQTLAQVNSLLKDLESGKGTMGKLLKDDAMYVNLTKASKELELLLVDFKKNPKRYVHFSMFGKKPAEYKAN